MKNLIFAFNINSKSDFPTDRDGRPDNYHYSVFETDDEYQQQLEIEFTRGRNLIKTSKPESMNDFLKLEDGTIIETSDYLDEKYAFENNMADKCPPRPSFRINNKGKVPFTKSEEQKARQEVLWYGNH